MQQANRGCANSYIRHAQILTVVRRTARLHTVPRVLPFLEAAARTRGGAERRALRATYTCAFAAVLKRSGVNGTVRILTPVASKTALEIADGTTAADGSPAPHGGSWGRLISSDSTTGTSGNVRIG